MDGFRPSPVPYHPYVLFLYRPLGSDTSILPFIPSRSSKLPRLGSLCCWVDSILMLCFKSSRHPLSFLLPTSSCNFLKMFGSLYYCACLVDDCIVFMYKHYTVHKIHDSTGNYHPRINILPSARILPSACTHLLSQYIQIAWFVIYMPSAV